MVAQCPSLVAFRDFHLSRLSCDELRRRVAEALDIFMFRVALAKGETHLEGGASLASKGLTAGDFDIQLVLGGVG